MAKPHVLCVPGLSQSHIGAMLKVAKILHHKGFFVTFVNSEFNHRRMLCSGGLDSLDSLPDWRFVSVSDGLPPSDADATQDMHALCAMEWKRLAAEVSSPAGSSENNLDKLIKDVMLRR